MHIKGIFLNIDVPPEYLDIKTIEGDIATIRLDDITVNDDNTFEVCDAYFLGTICDDYDSEVKCLYDVLESIVERPELDLYYNELTVSDEAGELYVQVIDSEDVPGQRDTIKQIRWHQLRSEPEETKTEAVITKESKTAVVIDDYSKKTLESEEKVTYEENSGKYIEPAEKHYITIEEIEKISESVSNADRAIQYKTMKELQKEHTKDVSKDDFER